jgi:hypothetical protein
MISLRAGKDVETEGPNEERQDGAERTQVQPLQVQHVCPREGTQSHEGGQVIHIGL